MKQLWHDKGIILHEVLPIKQGYAVDPCLCEIQSPRGHLANTADGPAQLMVGHPFQMQTPPLVPFPDLVTPEAAYQLYDPPGIDPRLITRVSGVVSRSCTSDSVASR